MAESEAAADPLIEAPLAGFHGERPSAPAWFDDALAHPPERSVIDVAGAGVELLTWGEVGRPGLLLLHGNGAHADWWSFVAPLLAEDFRVAAISWSGMGGSGWRPQYAGELFVEEMMAAVDAAGLEAAGPPRVVAHSFGGYPLLLALASEHGGRFRSAVSLDSPVRPPEMQWRGPPARTSANRVYPTLEAALARFRLAPTQPCPNLFILDHIARRALRTAPLDGGHEGMGWTWRFDPDLWRGMKMEERTDLLAGARCPLAVVYGARSQLMTPQIVAYMRQHAPEGTPFVSIPEAEHHVWLDQPLAFVATLRALFAAWG